MVYIKENKGITLVSLVITVIILLILSGVTMYNYKSTNDISKYNDMVTDIKLLKDEILIYYNKYGELPKTNRQIDIGDEVYYEIDLSKLNNLILNYGENYNKEDELTNSSDVYVMNSNLNIYYLKGIENSGKTYHEVI